MESMRQNDALLTHLATDYTDPIRDPLWGHIYLSGPMMDLVSTAEFQQLARIKQLGPSYLVYPGATHTRLNHSLGVFHIARRILDRLAAHPLSPALSLEAGTAFLAAALLHDVGHFPYTHGFRNLDLTEHEVLTGQIVQDGAIAHILRTRVGVDPQLVAAIVDEHLDSGQSEEVELFRRLLSGSMDPDKLDYLNRDAYFCGVPYGLQDLDFALSRIVPDGYDGIGLEESGVTAVENILFSKYLMYRAVYWHRTVRVATAMIKKAVYLGLHDGAIEASDLYGLDDESFLIGIGGRDYLPFALIRRVGSRDLLKPAVDIPYDPEDPSHRRLTSIAERTRLEDRAAELIRHETGYPLEAYQTILDLPDAVSFEANFPIFSDGRRSEFVDKSVFTPEVVNRFTESLRRIRLIVPQEVAVKLENPRQILNGILDDS